MEDFTGNVDWLKALGLFFSVSYTIFKSTELYQTHSNRKLQFVNLLADKAVAWVWHNYMRDKVDSAAKTGVPVEKEVEQKAHNMAADFIQEKAKEAGVDSLIPGRIEASALVVQAVKRLKAGTSGQLHTGPSTKGS